MADFSKVVDEAYEQYKSDKDGAVDPRLNDVKPHKTGISVVFSDGTSIDKGDTDIASPLGSIVKIPIAAILLSQNSPEELVKKSGCCPCCRKQGSKPKISVSRRGIRAVSAIEPTGDPDSKWNFIENQMINMMGSAPQLDDKLYERLTADANSAEIATAIAETDYKLLDDPKMSIDLFLRAQSMTATTRQLATMGATIAADGVNPSTNEIVFDGAISQRIVGMMAAKGPHKMTLPWNLMAGIPAKSSFGGAMLAVYPGLCAIAAYGPEINQHGVSVKASKVIMYIMNKLGISVFASAKVKIEK